MNTDNAKVKKFGCYLVMQHVFDVHSDEYWENPPERKLFLEVPTAGTEEGVKECVGRFFQEPKNISKYGDHHFSSDQHKSPKHLISRGGSNFWQHFEIGEVFERSHCCVTVGPSFLKGNTGEL